MTCYTSYCLYDTYGAMECTCVCVCSCVYLYVCMYVWCVCVCINIYIYIYIYIYGTEAEITFHCSLEIITVQIIKKLIS